MTERLTEIRNALAELDEEKSLGLIAEALAGGDPANDVLKACQEGMSDVGDRFEAGDYFVAELVFSGELFKQAAALLRPHLTPGDAGRGGRIVIGTVKGDIHDLGKNIVVLMLEAAGFDVIDLGVDVPPERFIEALRDSGATVLGLSGLLTFAFGAMQRTVASITAAGLRDRVRIMVGGGPVDAKVCEMAGADGWGPNANAAVRLAKEWLR